ncbi:MAG TPA: CPBP family intramembrane metalloprotease [Clostridiaceae bacterium]|nr:CPBP family intramembrane metalloprotease [Clostridiaceae bacterium]
MGEIFGRERRRKEGRTILMILLLGSIITFFLDAQFQFGYGLRSAIKVVLFIGMPWIMYWQVKSMDLFSVLRNDLGRSAFRKSVVLGLGVYVFLLVLYVLIKDFLDLGTIEEALQTGAMVNRDNFLFIALYIPLVNAFLEEFFFRGFGFLKLRASLGRGPAYLCSALLFSLYHVGIIDGWANPLITLLALLGLFISGLFFNFLNEKNGHIYNSYMVHMFANLAINTIGLQMFGFIHLPFLG